MKKFEAELAQEELEEKQDASKQVFMTSKEDDGAQGAANPPPQAAQDAQAAGEHGDPPPTANTIADGLPEIHSGPRPLQPAIPVEQCLEDFVTPADKIVYGTLAVSPLNTSRM
jgi:hypothetical protein